MLIQETVIQHAKEELNDDILDDRQSIIIKIAAKFYSFYSNLTFDLYTLLLHIRFHGICIKRFPQTTTTMGEETVLRFNAKEHDFISSCTTMKWLLIEAGITLWNWRKTLSEWVGKYMTSNNIYYSFVILVFREKKYFWHFNWERDHRKGTPNLFEKPLEKKKPVKFTHWRDFWRVRKSIKIPLTFLLECI